MPASAVENVEIRLLLEGLAAIYGHDFRGYADTSIRRRLKHWLAESGFATFSEAQSRLLRDPELFGSLLKGVTVNVTEMFRDPPVFKALREQVAPYLKTYPFVKVWVAGCSSGEEAYSMAILLREEGLAGRYRIYATDINEDVLQRAGAGTMALADMQTFTRNYQQSGGHAAFADYYTVQEDRVLLDPELRKAIVFAPHNLATDAEFGEMHLVLCRNVMIYFKPELRERCLRLFDSSLAPGGFLCLGQKESLERRSLGARYEEVARSLRIYRKSYQLDQPAPTAAR